MTALAHLRTDHGEEGLGEAARGGPRRPWLPAVAPSPLVLPRARALTDMLVAAPLPRGACAPEGSPHVLQAGAVARTEARLVRLLADSAPGARPRAVVRVGPFELACALAGRASPRSPFRWHARAARRTIGLAAVRALLDGIATAPTDAVSLVLADPSGPAGVGRSGPGSCADWLGSLAPAARSIVGAEAVTWATQLWTGLEWERLGPDAATGGPDRWWLSPGEVPIAVRGRADVRAGGALRAHLTVLDGHPRPSTRTALVLSALVDALRHGPQAAPARVVGWWPASGRAWAIDVDARALMAAADGVALAARAALGAGDVLPGAA